MLYHGLDHALLLEVLDAAPRERAVDLHAVDEGGDGDEAVRLDILVELLGGGLVEDDGVLGLVLDLALGPSSGVSFSIARRSSWVLESAELHTTATRVSICLKTSTKPMI